MKPADRFGSIVIGFALVVIRNSVRWYIGWDPNVFLFSTHFLMHRLLFFSTESSSAKKKKEKKKYTNEKKSKQ